jgi:5'-nucleotidase / UDP-sugar diphosphatase
MMKTWMTVGVAMLVVVGGCRIKSRPQADVLEPLPPIDSINSTPAIDMTSTPTAPAPVPVPATVVEAPAPRTHVVQPRDTLYSIARQYYNDGTKWPRIQAANPGLVPERLPLGKSIIIP